MLFARTRKTMLPRPHPPRILIWSVASLLHASCVFSPTQAQPSDAITFDHVSVEHGLPSSTITAILHDSRGFLWFGTSKGLGRYDGYDFLVPVGISSRFGDFVYALREDRAHNIWIATIGAGLTRYDPVHADITKFTNDASVQSSLRNDSVYSIYQDHSGQMWVGTLRGLDRFDSTTQGFAHVFPDAFSPPIPSQTRSLQSASDAVNRGCCGWECWEAVWYGWTARRV